MMLLHAFNICIIILNCWAVATGMQCWQAVKGLPHRKDEYLICRLFTCWGGVHLIVVMWWCTHDAWLYPPLYMVGHIVVSFLFGILSIAIGKFHIMTLMRALENEKRERLNAASRSSCYSPHY